MKNKQNAADNVLEILLFESSGNDETHDFPNDATVFEMAKDVGSSKCDERNDASINSGAQLTIVEKQQVLVYCRYYDETVRPTSSSRVSRFENIAQDEFGSI